MALFAHSRPGTSAAFWRNHNALQETMIAACASAARPRTPRPMATAAVLPAPAWMPTAEQRARYLARKKAADRATAVQ